MFFDMGNLLAFNTNCDACDQKHMDVVEVLRFSVLQYLLFE